MKNERVVITGSEGFIGSSLANKFRNQGFSFMEVDKVAKNISANLDLTDFDALSSSFNEYKPTILFHAGTHSAGAYNNNFLPSYEEDSCSLINLLTYLSDKPEVLFVFFCQTDRIPM